MHRSILLPIDLNHPSSWAKAAPLAVSLARSSKAELHVFMAIPDYGMSVVGSFFPPGHSEKAISDTNSAMEAFVSEHIPSELNAQIHVRHGTIYKEIISTADSLKCDLIVMASHRPDTQDYLLGPNAARVVRHARQSVFVVRE